uniref:Uncharacterized protein n=1 Tax=Pipistrellus kuhlii TaxID=59472 RepID=A0A7J7UGE8_PIPKU|nr:hypothetical protein mPipKuh1_009069 [Pipistrellus kuhlii]
MEMQRSVVMTARCGPHCKAWRDGFGPRALCLTHVLSYHLSFPRSSHFRKRDGRLPPPSVRKRQARGDGGVPSPASSSPTSNVCAESLHPSSSQSTSADPDSWGGCSPRLALRCRCPPMRSPGAILPSSAPSSKVAGHTRLPGPYLPCAGCSLAASPGQGAEPTARALDIICRRTEGCCPPFQCDIPQRLCNNVLVLEKNSSRNRFGSVVERRSAD